MIGEEEDISAGLPLVRLVVLATDEEEEEEEEDGRGSRAGDCVVGGVLGTPAGDVRREREYVRRAGAAVEVSLGGDGMRMWGDAAVAPGILGVLIVDTEGAGVSGGGGEDVAGVSVGPGESSSMGLGVSLGGLGAEGAEQSGVPVGGLVPPAASLCSDWLCWTSSLSILQCFRTLERISGQHQQNARMMHQQHRRARTPAKPRGRIQNGQRNLGVAQQEAALLSKEFRRKINWL